MILTNIADNLRWAGHQSEPLPYYGRARDIALADMAADPRDASMRALFAYLCARLGDRTRAEQEIKQAINTFCKPSADWKCLRNLSLASLRCTDGAQSLIGKAPIPSFNGALNLSRIDRLLDKLSSPVKKDSVQIH